MLLPPFPLDVFGEADLVRKTSVIFEALQRFGEHAQCASEQRSQAAVQRAGRGSHTDRSLRVRAVDLQLAVRTTDASPFSLAHLFSVIKVAKSRRGTRESTLTWLCLRGFVVRKVGGRAFSCLSVERRRRRRKAGLFGGLTTRSMLLTKMDLLNYQYLDKMNNNISILCYEGKATRLGCFSVLCFFFPLVFWKLRQRKLAAPSFRWNELAQVSRSCVEKTVGSAVIWFVLRFFLFVLKRGCTPLSRNLVSCYC